MPNKTKSWFEQNMHAQKTGSPVGECSFCSLRNLPKFCEMVGMACSVVTDDNIYTVTWQPNEKGITRSLENCMPPREMIEFFNNTNPDEIQRIASEMVHNMIGQKQK